MFASTKRAARYIAAAFIVVFFVAFSISNRSAVLVSFFPFPYTAELPLFLLALACLVLGSLVAGIILSLRLSRLNRLFKREKKHSLALKNELEGLKSLSSTQTLPVTHV